MYFIGVAAVLVSAIILKKTKPFSGEAAPFVMELPAYHIPSAKTVLMHTWERLWGFIKKAGTILFLACIVMWVLSTFGFENGGFGAVEDVSNSLMALLGGAIAWIFAPLGFGSWQPVAASISGFSAKEAIVTTMGVLANVDESMVEETAVVGAAIQSWFPNVAAAFSFLVFNLLDSSVPCRHCVHWPSRAVQKVVLVCSPLSECICLWGKSLRIPVGFRDTGSTGGAGNSRRRADTAFPSVYAVPQGSV